MEETTEIQTESPLIIEGAIKYKMTFDSNGYKIEIDKSLESTVVGLRLAEAHFEEVQKVMDANKDFAKAMGSKLKEKFFKSKPVIKAFLGETLHALYSQTIKAKQPKAE